MLSLCKYQLHGDHSEGCFLKCQMVCFNRLFMFWLIHNVFFVMVLVRCEKGNVYSIFKCLQHFQNMIYFIHENFMQNLHYTDYFFMS